MAIHTLSFRRESADYDRRSTVRVDTLKEVVEKIKKGEDVDVEKELGTGDPEKELAWEERTLFSLYHAPSLSNQGPCIRFLQS